MSRWIAMHCGDDAEALQAQHPNAFLLLCQIARRAKWKDCRITKMKKGEALIGDWKEAGIHSQMAYRIAKQTLSDCGLATFQGTNKGTRATLTNTTIFSLSSQINNEPENEPENEPTTNKERSNNDPTTTNHTETRGTQSTQTHPEGQAPKPAKKFQQPTLEEITDYGRTLSPPFINADRFFNHYTSNGWKVGSSPMKDWKAAVRNWQLKDTTNRPHTTVGNHRTIHVGGRKPSGIMTFDDDPTENELPEDADALSIVHAYPRRQDDTEALECVRASIRKGADPAVILAGTRAIAAIIPQLPSSHLNAFVVSAGTFFRKEKWRDDPQTWLRNAGHKNGEIAKPLNLGGRRPGPPIESFSNPDTP